MPINCLVVTAQCSVSHADVEPRIGSEIEVVSGESCNQLTYGRSVDLPYELSGLQLGGRSEEPQTVGSNSS